MFFLLVSVIVLGGGILAFIILLFWARPERWIFKSFCLWLATWVSWGCCPPLYVWIERNGGGRVGKDVLMRCYLLSLLLA